MTLVFEIWPQFKDKMFEKAEEEKVGKWLRCAGRLSRTRTEWKENRKRLKGEILGIIV